MSVEVRLREAFGETDRSWDEQVPGALAAVTSRRHRESVVRRGAAVTLVAAAAVAAVAVTVSQPADEDPVPIQVPTLPPSITTGERAEPNPLDGKWTSGPVTSDDVRAAAANAGRADVAASMLERLPARPFRIVLVITGSGLNLGYRSREGVTSGEDVEMIEVDGSEVVLRPRFAPGGANVHTWVVQDGALRMDFVSTTEDDKGGVPAEAWQRLLYDTEAFSQ